MGRLTLDCDIDSSCGTPGTRQGRSTWIPVQEGAAPASRSLLPLSLLTPHLFFPSSSSKFEKSSISSPFSVAFAPSGPPALQFHCLQSVSASSAAAHSLPFQIEVPELPATRPGLSPGVYRVPPWDSSRSWYYHRAQKPLFGTLVCCVLTGSEFACTAPCRPPFTSIGALCAGLQLFLACQRVAACALSLTIRFCPHLSHALDIAYCQALLCYRRLGPPLGAARAFSFARDFRPRGAATVEGSWLRRSETAKGCSAIFFRSYKPGLWIWLLAEELV